MFDCTILRDWLARPAILVKAIDGNHNTLFVREDPHLYTVRCGQPFRAFISLEHWPRDGADNFDDDNDECSTEFSHAARSGFSIWCATARRPNITILDWNSFPLAHTQLGGVPHVEAFIHDNSGLLKSPIYTVGRSVRTAYESTEVYL